MLKIEFSFCLIVFARSAISINVFSFNSTDESDQLSTVLLANTPRDVLPEKFTVCFAMKQDKIDHTSPFLIRLRFVYSTATFGKQNKARCIPNY